jgi:predicted ATP-grasp superfamily ATP-dependent carboligase
VPFVPFVPLWSNVLSSIATNAWLIVPTRPSRSLITLSRAYCAAIVNVLLEAQVDAELERVRVVHDRQVVDKLPGRDRSQVVELVPRH